MPAETEPEAPLHLWRLEIDSYMRVSAFTVELEGNSVVILGKNAEGKTSVINSIWEVFASDSRARPEPIASGSTKALIRMTLADDNGVPQFVLEKHITPSGSRLVVTAADGSKVSKTKSLVDSLLDQVALDPVGFLALRPQDQIDQILAVCDIKPPVTQVNMLTKASYPAKENETADGYMARLSADDTGLFFVKRLNEGREVTRLQGAVAKQVQYVSDESGKISVDQRSPEAVKAELDKSREMDKFVAAEMAKKKDADAKETMAKQRYLNADAAVDLKIEDIKNLKQKLAEAEEMLDDLKTTAALAMMDHDEANAAAILLKVEPRSLDHTKKLEAEMSTIYASNKQITVVEEANKHLTSLRSELETAQAIHNNTDVVLTELRALRKQILEGVDIGVPRLAIVDGKLRLNDKPFLQASDAERIKVAVGVATKRNPRLKLLRVDRGESLDEDNQKLLMQLAAERGFQVILAKVAPGSLRAEIVEGE